MELGTGNKVLFGCLYKGPNLAQSSNQSLSMLLEFKDFI